MEQRDPQTPTLKNHKGRPPGKAKTRNTGSLSVDVPKWYHRTVFVRQEEKTGKGAPPAENQRRGRDPDFLRIADVF